MVEVDIVWVPVTRRNFKFRSVKVTQVAVKWKRRPLRLVTHRVNWTHVDRNSRGEFVIEQKMTLRCEQTPLPSDWEEVHLQLCDLSLEDHTRWWSSLQSDAIASKSASEDSYQFPSIPLSQPSLVHEGTDDTF